MRKLRNRQLELGEIRIEDIKLNLKSRDGVPALLIGLQYLYSQEALRNRLFAIMDECILPGINRKVGRPGMAMWNILVMGVVKRGLGCDFDWLHELVNEHKTLRNFLGHTDCDKSALPLSGTGRQCEPAKPESAWEGQPVDRGERPCGRGQKAWRALARAL